MKSTQQGRSSIGRALVSKTRGWGFDALRPCHRIQNGRATARSGTEDTWQIQPHLPSRPSRPAPTRPSSPSPAALVVGAVVAFYALGQQDLWLRVAALLVLIVAAAATFFTSEPGKQLIAYGRDSVREVKKVVWPTRKEALQMTGYVFAFVVVMALFLWLTDKTLEWVLYDLVLGWKR